jgi:aryl-alcohol dehydrogenase-like predicted oxidoreductase
LQKIRLGDTDVSRLGLGCMAMSGGYGPPDDAESIATIHAAIEAGVTLIDTGDFYGMGHNEMLLRDALKGGKRERVFIGVKFGALRGPDGAWLGYDLRPDAVKNFLAYTLRRLGTDYIDLYQPARVDDAAVPIEDTIGAIADLIKEGYVRNIGLSEASAATVRRAHAVHRIAALQIEYSLVSRGIEKDILPAARELNIPVVAYGVLSRGLLASQVLSDAPVTGAIRARMPRFLGDNLARNRALVEALATIAREKGVSIPQLAFAWVRSRGPDIVPLIGARRREQLADCLGALAVTLSGDDLARIERAVPAEAVAGTRYAPAQMAHLDSERPA